MINQLIEKCISRIIDNGCRQPYLKPQHSLLNTDMIRTQPRRLSVQGSVCLSLWAAREAISCCVVRFPYWKSELYLAQFPWKIPVYVLSLCLMQNDGTCRRLSLWRRLSVWSYYLSADESPQRAKDGSFFLSSRLCFKGKLDCLHADVN